ncbi:hypothetical protein N0V90_003253 [Kalmusia sp. IMI 367209]|nr:hypothetical protein N0V90_003253 [Kalmusia sp. IMI 367209]
MANKGNLIVQTKQVKHTLKKKRVGFLDLPGELRNQVYDYYFQQGFRCDFAGKKAQLGCPTRKVIKFCIGYNFRPSSSPEDNNDNHKVVEDKTKDTTIEPTVTTLVRFSRVLGRYERIQGLDTRWSTSLTGLIFVCKQVYAETIGFFYKSTIFSFDSPNRVFNFLKVPSANSLASVTKIQLHYHTYGDPVKSEHLEWKQKHLHSWNRTCKAVAKQLVNLQCVDIWIRMNESVICLDIHAPCLKPVFYFRRRCDPAKTLAKALIRANVHVDTIWSQPNAFTNPRLCLASVRLHQLFGQAISRLILGATQATAMADFNDAWENKYAQWHHHLDFARTGW